MENMEIFISKSNQSWKKKIFVKFLKLFLSNWPSWYIINR